MTEEFYRPRQPGYARLGAEDRALYLPRNQVLQTFVLTKLPEGEEIPVVPDGCDDLLFLFDGERVRGYVSPSLLQASPFRFPGVREIIGVRFAPGSTANFLGRPLPETRQALALGELWPEVSRLEEQLRGLPDARARQQALVTALERQLRPDTEVQRLVKACVERMRTAPCSVEELAAWTGYSDRYLRQRFLQVLGCAPKKLAGIFQVQALLTTLERRPEIALADLAADAGFADQSHMNRVFRGMLGVTPGQLRRDGLGRKLGRLRTFV